MLTHSPPPHDKSSTIKMPVDVRGLLGFEGVVCTTRSALFSSPMEKGINNVLLGSVLGTWPDAFAERGHGA